MNLLKQKSWAVVIIDENEDSKEIKIINLLKENNYNVVGINLNNYKSDKFHVYDILGQISLQFLNQVTLEDELFWCINNF